MFFESLEKKQLTFFFCCQQFLSTKILLMTVLDNVREWNKKMKI